MKTVNQVVRAYAKGVDSAPRKVGIIASLVRDRTVADALVILDHVPRRASLPVKKVIESAQANATNNHNFDGKTLKISTISVTAGPRLKRFKPASRGRALPYQKRTSHILVELTGTKKPAKVAKPAAVTAPAETKPSVTKSVKKPTIKKSKTEETA